MTFAFMDFDEGDFLFISVITELSLFFSYLFRGLFHLSRGFSLFSRLDLSFSRERPYFTPTFRFTSRTSLLFQRALHFF